MSVLAPAPGLAQKSQFRVSSPIEVPFRLLQPAVSLDSPDTELLQKNADQILTFLSLSYEEEAYYVYYMTAHLIPSNPHCSPNIGVPILQTKKLRL